MNLYRWTTSLFFIALSTFQCSLINADIILSITPAYQTVYEGANLTFDVSIRSDFPDQNIAALAFELYAGAGDGLSGSFTSGTSSFFGAPDPSLPAWDFTDAGRAFFAIAVDPARTLGTTNLLLGQVVLSTMDVVPGLYSASFDISQFSASDGSNNAINVQMDPGNFAALYEVTAVPEPASLAMLGLVSSVWGVRRYRRKKTVSA